MSELTEDKLHREFELERMILFSDAVFAIAITLLIIEIKFPELPEHHEGQLDLWAMFKPTLGHFLAFLLSFFFIGMSWARHLKMFRYLRAYDNGVIFLNLASLFFIVAFPFSASGLTHTRPSFMLPVVIYMGNVMLIFVSNYFLAHYIFKRRPALSIPGFGPEKKYIYLQNMAFAIALSVGFIVLLITAIFSGYDEKSMSLSFYAVTIMLLLMRRWLKKHKPKKVDTLKS